MLDHGWDYTQKGGGTDVQDTGEEQNAISKKLQAAKTTVQQLFNGTDDALFEMADRSRNDADQHHPDHQ